MAVAALLTTGCKTSESNYRAAYEIAKGRQESAVDSTIYSRYRPQGKGAKLVAGADSLTMFTLAVGYTADGGADASTLKRYNVVVGQFKQIFNAREMRKRLIGQGYEGAMIVHNREPLYYVIAESCDTPEQAAAAIARLRADSNIVLREPFPWVLRPAHLAR